MTSTITFTIPQLLQLFLTACAALGTIAGAVVVIKKVIDYFKKPNDLRDEDLKLHAQLLDNDNKRIKDLEEWRKHKDEYDRIMLHATRAILRHSIDGNQVEALEESDKEINVYLENR